MIASYTQSILTLLGLWFLPVGIAFGFAWATNHAPDWSARWYAAGQSGLTAGAVGAGCSAAFPFLDASDWPGILAFAAAVWGVGGLAVAPWALFLLAPPIASAISRRGGGIAAYALAGAVGGGAAAWVALGVGARVDLLIAATGAVLGAVLIALFHQFEVSGQ